MIWNVLISAFNLIFSAHTMPPQPLLMPRLLRNRGVRITGWVEQRRPDRQFIHGGEAILSGRDPQTNTSEKPGEVELSPVQEKMEYLGKISHELRSPLTTIMGVSEMLDYGVYGPLSREQKEAVNLIVDASKQIHRLVNDLLQQSELEHSQFSLEASNFSPADIAARLRRHQGPDALAKGLSFVVKVDETMPPQLHGDPVRLFQVLQNLCGNAIKYTPTGQVSVRFFRAEPEYYCVEVSDSGIGIPEAMRNAIFEPFTRLHSSPGENGNGIDSGGYGLGLAVVRQLIALMKGDIRVEGKDGGGSVFTVRLPVSLSTENGQ